MSAAKSDRLASRIARRFGDPASSSPSNMNLMFDLCASPGGADRVEGRQLRDDRRLVVGGAARVDARLGNEGRSRGRQRDHGPCRLDCPVAQCRGKRRRRPFLRIQRLAVVVRIEANRARGSRRSDLAKHDRVRAWHRDQRGRCTALDQPSRMASALRWMLAVSRETFGIASSAMNSSTIARSCCWRHWRAACAAGDD